VWLILPNITSNVVNSIQFNPLKFPIYVSAKPVGAACNLRCDYCYFLEKQFEGAPERMSDEMLERFTEQYVHAQPGQDVLFTWHGGEPLLLGLEYFKKALRFQKPFKRNYNIDNVLQTNGTLLNEEWCRFFKENNFLIGLSLDGPEHCHDKYRRNVGSKGSFVQVMRGLELLIKHNVEFNILSVVNNYNVQFPLEVYRFFKSIGANYIQFTPVVERLDDGTGLLKSGDDLGGKLTEWSVQPLAYGAFLNQIFDEWVRNDVGNIFVTTFDSTLAGHVGASPGTCIWAETCGHASALDIDGSLYSCDHYVFPDFKLGNIRQQTITEMMLTDQQFQFGNDKRDKLPEACKRCTYLKLCHGECPKNRIQVDEGELHPLNYLCSGLKFYFSHTESYMQFMAAELANERPPANIMQHLVGK
jgi:uncharacterized protein